MAYLRRAADWPNSDGGCVKLSERIHVVEQSDSFRDFSCSARDPIQCIYSPLPCLGRPDHQDQDDEFLNRDQRQNLALQPLLENPGRPEGR